MLAVGSSYGALVTGVVHDADGLAVSIGYCDVAKTTTEYTYDDKRRLRTVQTYRGPPPIWSGTTIVPTPTYGSGAPTTFQLLLEDTDFSWKGFREDHRFTGKEGDEEVGLTYFGFRYLAPLLARRASADPLTIHTGAADANVYAYVHGHALRAVDARGTSSSDEPPITLSDTKIDSSGAWSNEQTYDSREARHGRKGRPECRSGSWRYVNSIAGICRGRLGFLRPAGRC